jgi:nucleoside 2-deoxyribosyltransferase
MKQLFNVYLAGPIRYNPQTDKIDSYDVDWRKYVEYRLEDLFNVCNPIEFNEQVRDDIRVYGFINDEIQKKLYNNDICLIDQPHIMIANLLPYDHDNYPSLGTLYEIGYARRCIPVVIICSEDSLIRQNPMYYDCCKVNNIDDSIKKVIEIIYGDISIESINDLITKFQKTMSEYDYAFDQDIEEE